MGRNGQRDVTGNILSIAFNQNEYGGRRSYGASFGVYGLFTALYEVIPITIPIRMRHIFNRRRNVRLRYVVSPAIAMLLVSGISSVSFSPVSYEMASVEAPAAVEVSQPAVIANKMADIGEVSRHANLFAALDLDARDRDAQALDVRRTHTKTVELPQVLLGNSKSDDVDSQVEREDVIDTHVLAQEIIKPKPREYNVERFISNALDNHRDGDGQIRRKLKQGQDAEILLASASQAAAGNYAPRDKHLKIGRGDTITGVLKRAGISPAESYKAVQAMSKHLDPRSIRPGQILTLSYNADRSANEFGKMLVALDKIKTVVVEKSPNGKFDARLDVKKVETKVYARRTTVQNSLYGSAEKSGIPAAVIANAIRIYSWDVDFQRDIRKGDSLEVLYDQKVTADGDVAQNGNIIYAKLTIGGTDYPIYRHKMSNGRTDYFSPKGYSIRKALLRTLVDGGRISSGYGMRRHPVLGYNKMHKGMDFAASRGTPIYAAGDGVVERASRNGGYGNYVRIRHNSKLKTAYAHMQKFARGVKSGKRVRQGDVIGYVGTTGRSTGPHLHYEVLVNGKQTNPKKLDLPTGEILTGSKLKKFKSQMARLNQTYSEKLGEYGVMKASY